MAESKPFGVTSMSVYRFSSLSVYALQFFNSKELAFGYASVASSTALSNVSLRIASYPARHCSVVRLL